MDDLYYKQVISLLLFPNRSEEELAKHLSVTDQFLWRRDSFRLVAFNLGKKHGDWDYLFEDISDLKGIQSIHVNDEGTLSFSSKYEAKEFFPIQKKFHSHSLKTLFEKEHHTEFEIPGKELSRLLSIFQRKVSNSSIKPENVTLVLDLKKKMMSLKELNESKSIPITIKKGDDAILSYSFLFFRDLLINGNKFGHSISFKTLRPYFTSIRYDKNLYAVLTHKKD